MLKKFGERRFKIISVVLIILFLFCFFNSFFGIFDKRVCGDGTRYLECSKNIPYYCSKGTLIQNASFCGCPGETIKNGSFCDYEYQTSPKTVAMNYTLRGETKAIDFIVYKGMEDYLKKHPFYSLYSNEDNYTLQDFKLRIINEPEQRKLLLPLVVEIQNAAKSKEEQARIAISLVQNVPYEEDAFFEGNNPLSWSMKYPYEVVYDQEGLCGSKSDLLVFLLKEIGYGTIIFHYSSENHEAVGIKCSKKYSLDETGYCFVESTQPAVLSYSDGEYSEQGKLYSSPKIIFISNGISLNNNMEEFRDAQELKRISKASDLHNGKINFMEYTRGKQITKKYGLGTF